MKNKYTNIQNTKDNIDWSGPGWEEMSLPHLDRTIRLGSTFSGIGAIEQALKKLHIKTKIMFAGDIDSDCKKAYLANYDTDGTEWYDDIINFDARPYYGKIDLLVGGAPCQAFSMRGKRGGFEDTRGTLFREFARIIIECNPKVFIFENVKGMLNHDKGNTWKIIKETFEDDCDYCVYYQILNGKDYGIPQSRERLFCVGFREETEFKFPKPIALSRTKYDFLDKIIEAKYFLKNKGVNFITRTINHEKEYTQINGDIMLCQKRNQQFNWHGDFVFHPALVSEEANSFNDEYLFNINDFEERYFINNDINKYGLIKLKNGDFKMVSIEQENLSRTFGRYRKLTPRECLRLMGFDESFKIVVSDTATYKQAGNSIIVDVLEALLKQIQITNYGKR